MLLGRRFGSLSGAAAAQILGLRARLTSPCVALPPLTPPVGRPLACRQALPRVRGSRLGILSTVIEHAAQGAWPPHWRPCHLWPPRRMPHGPVRRFWPRGPLWAARPDDPVARVRLRPSGRPACGSRQARLGQLVAKKYGTVSAGLMRQYDTHPEKTRKSPSQLPVSRRAAAPWPAFRPTRKRRAVPPPRRWRRGDSIVVSRRGV